MSKIVLIQAIPTPGFNFYGEAHRLWPANAPVKVEILDQEEDPPEVAVKRKRGDDEVIELAPDPNRIGRRSFRALQASPRIRILSDSETIESAQVSAAQDEAARLRAENQFLRSEVSTWEVENDQLRARVLELERAAGVSPSPLPRSPEETAAGADEEVMDHFDEAEAEVQEQEQAAADDEADAKGKGKHHKGKPHAKAASK